MKKMKKGMSQIVMGGKTLRECFEFCRDAGYEGLELTMRGELNFSTSDAAVKEIAAMAGDFGIELCSLCCGNPHRLTEDDPKVVEQGVEEVTRALECSAMLGIDGMLIIPMWVTEGVRDDVAYARAVEVMQRLGDLAASFEVNLAIENVWANKCLYTPTETKRLIDDIGREYVGSYFDVGNVVTWGWPEHWIEILGERIKKVHFKDFKRRERQFVPLMEGDVNWPKVMAAFRKIGYDGYVISEVGGTDEEMAEPARTMDRILAL